MAARHFLYGAGYFESTCPKRTWSVSRMANTAATRPQMRTVARQMWCKISLFRLMFWDLLQACCAFTPVHGWNHALVDRYSLECCWQRFIHPRGCKISTINPVSWETKRHSEAQYELNVSTNSQRKICTNDTYFAAEMPKHFRKGSRNMLWITHLQKSDNSGVEFAGSSHLEPKSHQSVVAPPHKNRTATMSVWLHVVFLGLFVSTFGANLSLWTLGRTLS